MGNYIGLDATGTADLGNTNQGIAIFNGSHDNIIGGTAAGAGNVISGNDGEGIRIINAGATGNLVQGNLIGTNAAGTAGIGNGGEGVWISQSAAGNTVGGTLAGAGNTIAYNGLSGVVLGSTAGSGNAILGNAIYANADLAIDLVGGTEDGFGVTQNDLGDGDSGSNNLQNYPVLATASTTGAQVTISGTLNSTASRTFRIEFFANSEPAPGQDASGHGEGERYLGFVDVTTDGSGDASINAVLSATVAVGESVTATATDLTTNDTSEFALNVVAAAPVPGFDLIYGDSTAGMPKVRTYDAGTGTWSSEGTTTATGDTVRWTIAETSPDGTEELVAVMTETAGGVELQIRPRA